MLLHGKLEIWRYSMSSLPVEIIVVVTPFA